MTSFKNGDRYVYAVAPVIPVLDRYVTIGDMRGRIFHDAQFTVCRSCNQNGHKPGDEVCPAKANEGEVVAFRSAENPLSNFFLCDITYKGKTHKSLEHAFQ